MFKISIIGLGYVGLPLALAFSKKFKVIGFDNNIKRINQLKKGIDFTDEVHKSEFRNLKNIIFTNDPDLMHESNTYIITVPTPVTNKKKPDLKYIKSATNIVAKYLMKNDIVIYESTVYPGFTEEVCVPILEKKSKLNHNKDFYTGYSPERINPGDKKRNLISIKKITSGSNHVTKNLVDKLYKTIIKAGTYKVDSIKIAEAAKIIENMQRDVNIAFMNQLSIFFNKINIPTEKVLKAASTKWNFLNFKPGLVGGHCVSVDPYYYIYKSNKIGVNSNLFSVARNINNSMPTFIVKKIITIMVQNKIKIKGSKILILGLSFKENCKDIRNSLVFDIYDLLIKNKINVNIYDPLINKNEYNFKKKYKLINSPQRNNYDIIFKAVNHDFFQHLNNKKITKFGKKNYLFIDLYNLQLGGNYYSIL